MFTTRGGPVGCVGAGERDIVVLSSAASRGPGRSLVLNLALADRGRWYAGQSDTTGLVPRAQLSEAMTFLLGVRLT